MGCGDVSDNPHDSRSSQMERKSIPLIYLIEDKIERRKKSYKKRPARESTTESQFKKESFRGNRALNSEKRIAEFSSKKQSEFSVDISKFVKEAKGNISDRYLVKSTIGKGAYGEVRLVKDKITGNERAMKVIKKEGCGRTNNLNINSEIEMLKSLDHPNIIKIYEFYQDEDSFYLITEYCSGGELYDRITKMKSFSEKEAVVLMKQILSAITYCHARKIVHRFFLILLLEISNLKISCSNLQQRMRT